MAVKYTSIFVKKTQKHFLVSICTAFCILHSACWPYDLVASSTMEHCSRMRRSRKTERSIHKKDSNRSAEFKCEKRAFSVSISFRFVTMCVRRYKILFWHLHFSLPSHTKMQRLKCHNTTATKLVCQSQITSMDPKGLDYEKDKIPLTRTQRRRKAALASADREKGVKFKAYHAGQIYSVPFAGSLGILRPKSTKFTSLARGYPPWGMPPSGKMFIPDNQFREEKHGTEEAQHNYYQSINKRYNTISNPDAAKGQNIKFIFGSGSVFNFISHKVVDRLKAWDKIIVMKGADLKKRYENDMYLSNIPETIAIIFLRFSIDGHESRAPFIVCDTNMSLTLGSGWVQGAGVACFIDSTNRLNVTDSTKNPEYTYPYF